VLAALDGLGPDRAATWLAATTRLADTLDALTTDRPYRPAVGWDVARDIIRDADGTQFDPAVVAAYETIADPVFAALAESVRQHGIIQRIQHDKE